MPSFFDDRRFVEASHLNGFSGNLIERWSEGRDETSLAAALAAGEARLHVLIGERALLRSEGGAVSSLFTPKEARAFGIDPDSVILLGMVPEGPRFAAQIPDPGPQAESELQLPDGTHAVDLRSLAIQGVLPSGELPALAHARSYLHWHAGSRFCGRCGGPLVAVRGGAGRACAACGTEVFPRVDPVVIMLAVDGERCLLGRQPRFAPGMYSALAGFLEPGETIEEAVRREVKEEAGIRIGRVAYHSSQAWPFPSSLMIGCHAEALTTDLIPDAAELEDCRWFERGEVELMLRGEHPDGLKTPPEMAIAHSLVAAFARWPETA
jgi:NAD+ diphosphatase